MEVNGEFVLFIVIVRLGVLVNVFVINFIILGVLMLKVYFSFIVVR